MNKDNLKGCTALLYITIIITQWKYYYINITPERTCDGFYSTYNMPRLIWQLGFFHTHKCRNVSMATTTLSCWFLFPPEKEKNLSYLNSHLNNLMWDTSEAHAHTHTLTLDDVGDKQGGTAVRAGEPTTGQILPDLERKKIPEKRRHVNSVNDINAQLRWGEKYWWLTANSHNDRH